MSASDTPKDDKDLVPAMLDADLVIPWSLLGAPDEERGKRFVEDLRVHRATLAEQGKKVDE